MNEEPSEGKEAPRRGRSPWSHFGLGFEIAVPIVLGLYGGYRLDLWLETSPWFLMVGAMLGMALGFYAFFKQVLPSRRKNG
jgi:F0F1-type ATP synthase assembly protein I